MGSPVRAKKQQGNLLPCGRERQGGAEFHSVEADELRVVWQQRLEKHLAENQLKRSDQRTQILEIFLESGAHLSAQQLVQKVSQRFPSIGAATVYRNLKIFTDAGILRETFADAQGRVFYEPFEEEAHHDHLICLDCGAVFEFHLPEIERLQEELLEKRGFREEAHRHVVYARCEQLRWARKVR